MTVVPIHPILFGILVGAATLALTITLVVLFSHWYNRD